MTDSQTVYCPMCRRDELHAFSHRTFRENRHGVIPMDKPNYNCTGCGTLRALEEQE